MYLGNTTDGLFHFPCPTSLNRDRTPAPTIHEAADGTRTATIYKNPATPRTWNITYRKDPNALTLLENLATSTQWYTRGKLQFIPTGADRINTLTPTESNLENLPSYTPNPITTTSGTILGYVAGDQYTRWVTKTLPLPPRQHLCVSAFITEKSTARISWRDPSGAEIRQESHPLTGEDPTIFSREHAIFTPPEGAASAWVGFTGVFTAPAITFGQELYPYGIGQRAESVIVQPGPATLLSALPTPTHQTIEEISYQVLELSIT